MLLGDFAMMSDTLVEIDRAEVAAGNNRSVEIFGASSEKNSERGTFNERLMNGVELGYSIYSPIPLLGNEEILFCPLSSYRFAALCGRFPG